MSIVVVAEKPSVARDIARVLGARKKAEGHLEGNGYFVTWALGHLVHFAEPDDYGHQWSGRWATDQLPMIPDQWQLKTERSTARQFQVVKRLINDAGTERVVCATDAGREGENIFRLIYEHARCRKPVQRLWVSSLTDEAIRDGFRRLRPGSAYDDLGQAARARAQADWLVGMNLTRAYTVHNRVLCTIGRVQTPTLAMIVQRDAQIASFRKAFFYELMAALEEGFTAKYSRKGQTRIDDKAEAERLHRALSPNRTGTVRKIERKIRRNHAPPLYDLTNLQRDANRRFGFTAAQVLEYAQALYETHKLISYPRTESRHISEDMVPKLPGILERLDHTQAPAALERLRNGRKLGKAYVDKTKLTDHHAILPTGKAPPPSLPPTLRKIYDLVVDRFVGVFLPDQVVEETTVILDIGGATFVAKGTVVLEPGWKRVEPGKAKGQGARTETRKEEDGRQGLPPLEEGQTVHVKAMDVVEKETQPPKPYTDATLLAAMKNAGREIEDDALAEAMKQTGLGTPATRAEIIEKLIRTAYVQRERKQLRATDKGRALIGLVAEPLRSPELTAEWEQQLKEVEEGKRAGGDFYGGIVGLVRELVPQVAQGPALSPEQAAVARKNSSQRKKRGGKRGSAKPAGLGRCPLCKEGEIVETAKAYGCSRYRDGCGFTIWKRVASHKLAKKQVEQLLREGRTGRIEGFTSKAGKPFATALKLGKGLKVEFDFSDGPRQATVPGSDRAPDPAEGTTDQLPASAAARPASEPLTCPKCGQGRIIEGRRGFGCHRFREGCDFVVWKEFGGKRLTEKQIHALIGKGKTGLLKGFRGKSGKKFDARLRLDPQWQVAFEFPERKPGSIGREKT
jgi:DNA topoisomerase-3